MHIIFRILLIVTILTFSINCQGGGGGRGGRSTLNDIGDVLKFINHLLKLISDLLKFINDLLKFTNNLLKFIDYIMSPSNHKKYFGEPTVLFIIKQDDVQAILLDDNEEDIVKASRSDSNKVNVVKISYGSAYDIFSSKGALLILCISVFIVIWVSWDATSTSPVSNRKFVYEVDNTTSKTETNDLEHVFRSGHWMSCYRQYKRWCGPHTLSLSFDHQELKVTGSGMDDVGTFSIDGVYSLDTGRIGLAKTYQEGTGDRSENLGHTVIIQLEWNFKKRQFDGKWYVQTKKYHGVDEFNLILSRPTTVVDELEHIANF